MGDKSVQMQLRNDINPKFEVAGPKAHHRAHHRRNRSHPNHNQNRNRNHKDP